MLVQLVMSNLVTNTYYPLQIKDAVGNEYGKPKDVVGEKRMAFTSHADSAFDVCFENLIEHGK
jgi:p24 family protein delta-1